MIYRLFWFCFALSLSLGVINWPAGAVVKVKAVAEAGLELVRQVYRESRQQEIGLGHGTRDVARKCSKQKQNKMLQTHDLVRKAAG